MKEQKVVVIIVTVVLGLLMSAPVWSGDEEGIRDAIRIVRDRFNVRDWESLIGKIEENEALLPITPGEGSWKDTLFVAGDVEAAQEGSLEDLDRGGMDSLLFEAQTGISGGGGLYPVESAGGDSSGGVWEVGKTPVVQPQRPYAFKPEKIYHDYVTTCEEEYPLEERKTMKGELREVFEEIPPEVGLFLEVQEIEVSGAHATAQVAYYFKAMADTERSKRYLALGKQKMTLQLDKRDERWKLKEVKGLVNTMKTVAKGK